MKPMNLVFDALYLYSLFMCSMQCMKPMNQQPALGAFRQSQQAVAAGGHSEVS